MSAVPRGLVILGFGGHARSVADIALTLGIKGLIFVDEAAEADESLWGFPVRKTFDDKLLDGWQAFAASGDNQNPAGSGHGHPRAILAARYADFTDRNYRHRGQHFARLLYRPPCSCRPFINYRDGLYYQHRRHS